MIRRLRYWLALPRLRRTLGPTRQAWRGMTPESRAAFVASRPRPLGITANFNPHDGVVDDLPYITKTSLSGTMYGGNTPTGHAIAYLRWTLYAYCTYTPLRPLANWGPWTYSPCAQGVYNTLVFFGYPGSYTCSEANNGWDVIDFVWAWNQ